MSEGARIDELRVERDKAKRGFDKLNSRLDRIFNVLNDPALRDSVARTQAKLIARPRSENES